MQSSVPHEALKLGQILGVEQGIESHTSISNRGTVSTGEIHIQQFYVPFHCTVPALQTLVWFDQVT
jgi:hypothetical protein